MGARRSGDKGPRTCFERLSCSFLTCTVGQLARQKTVLLFEHDSPPNLLVHLHEPSTTQTHDGTVNPSGAELIPEALLALHLARNLVELQRGMSRLKRKIGNEKKAEPDRGQSVPVELSQRPSGGRPQR